jgi:hypothetical protein
MCATGAGKQLLGLEAGSVKAALSCPAWLSTTVGSVETHQRISPNGDEPTAVGRLC